MTVSNYLRRQFDIGLAMLDEEMVRLGIPERGERNILIPQDALISNSVMLIQNTLGLVLFEKNRHLLGQYYRCDIGADDPMEPLTEFDDIPVKSIKVLCFGTATMAPTLTTKYGDIILGLSQDTVTMIYSQLAATVDLRQNNPAESDTDDTNVIKADFGKKR